MSKINAYKIRTIVKTQLLLKPIVKTEMTTSSGIILPGHKKEEKIEEAEVVSVGYLVNRELEENNAPILKRGDRVFYDMRYCTSLTLSTDEKDEDIFVMVDFEHVRSIL